MSKFLHQSVTQIAKAIREQRVTSVELTQACLDRIKQVNPKLNAIVQLRDSATLLAQAAQADEAVEKSSSLGPLHGVPFTLKDSFDASGVISTAGTPGRSAFVPSEDAVILQRLKQAGGILLGKTNTSELTLGYDTCNPIYGRTWNPYDTTLMPGGSSGGAAAIVACGGAAFDIGSDTGGSVRFPAAFSGITGLKPTNGRVPRTGHWPGPGGPFDSLTTIGPLARSVEDWPLLLSIIQRPDFKDSSIAPVPLLTPSQPSNAKLKGLLLLDDGVFQPSSEVVAAVTAAADVLAKAGVHIEERQPTFLRSTVHLLSNFMRGWDGGAWVRSMLRNAGTEESESSLTRYLSAQEQSPRTYIEILNQLDYYRLNMLKLVEEFDVIISPVAAFPAISHEKLPNMYEGISYSMMYNLTGLPAGAVYAGKNEHQLPLSVQVAAKPWREDVILQVSSILEQHFGTSIPPLVE